MGGGRRRGCSWRRHTQVNQTMPISGASLHGEGLKPALHTARRPRSSTKCVIYHDRGVVPYERRALVIQRSTAAQNQIGEILYEKRLTRNCRGFKKLKETAMVTSTKARQTRPTPRLFSRSTATPHSEYPARTSIPRLSSTRVQLSTQKPVILPQYASKQMYNDLLGPRSLLHV